MRGSAIAWMLLAAAASPAAAADGDVERGVALGLFASDPRWDYGPLLDEVRDLGATHVLLAVVWTQRTVGSARLHRQRGASADDDVIVRTLQQAKARGLSATLFPIVRLEQHAPDEWRGRIEPRAGVDAWFASYRDYILTMAGLARQGGAARLSVGSELVSLEHHDARWRALIADARARFPGRVLYSANWDHFTRVPFWDAVDDVGVTGYFELAANERLPTNEELARAWREPLASLRALKAATGKPLIVTEVGYPSMVGAARSPWDETRRAAVDLEGQARLIDAFCRAFRGPVGAVDAGDVAEGGLDGFYVWNWFGFGGPADTSYTPRNKPGAAALARCLRAPS